MHRGLLLIALLLLTATLGACPRRPAVVEDPLEALLARADQAWLDRGELGFEPTRLLLEEAYRRHPQSPEVLWRLVRLHVAYGLVEDDRRAAVSAFAAARQVGLECLALAPGFNRGREERAWDQAVLALRPPQQPCVLWAGWAWTRWLERLGPAAAALDLEPIDALLARARELDLETEPGLLLWAEGTLLAVRPPVEGGDPAAARELLEQAVARDPGDLTRRADLLDFVALPTGDRALLRAQTEAVATLPSRTPEDRAAAARVARLLERDAD